MQPHGSFKLSVIDRVIIIEAIGAWNYEAAVVFANEYKKRIEQLNKRPWACLIDLTNWELFTPEASDYLDDINRWAERNNQRFEVVVCGLSIQKALLEKNQEAFTNVETKFCENIEQAYEWLKSVGVLSSKH